MENRIANASLVRIARVNVDWVDYHSPGGIGEELNLHFNCWDEESNSLPGLGGYLDSESLVILLPDGKQMQDFKRLVLETARLWVGEFDLYDTPPAKFKIIQLHRGVQGGHSINVEFWRENDPIPSALLLEYFLGYPIAHNRKRQYNDETIINKVKDGIARLMDAANALVQAANQQRQILKRR